MGCRCSDIRACDRDITRLGTISGYLSPARSAGSSAATQMKTAASSLTGAIETPNIAAVSSLLGELYTAANTSCGTAVSSCGSAKSTVYSKRSGYSWEDSAWHAAQAAKNSKS